MPSKFIAAFRDMVLTLYLHILYVFTRGTASLFGHGPRLTPRSDASKGVKNRSHAPKVEHTNPVQVGDNVAVFTCYQCSPARRVVKICGEETVQRAQSPDSKPRSYNGPT
ncbi:hypothetical protein RRG08_030705 [Elysia crispata]|uniref:Uncharacterized protein n=1 Tax=Elysia crispata TaxID=231223 RepID=A0AAE1CSI1_9GAST|nr:hypothetical protein RRG08_030705 [Elysia crispata]